MATPQVKHLAIGPYSFNKPVTFTIMRYPLISEGWSKEEVLQWLRTALERTLEKEAHDKRRSSGKAARKSQAVQLRG